MPDFEARSREEMLALLPQLWEQAAQVEELLARITALEEEIARLRQDPPSGIARAVPSFVRENKPRPQKKPRKKRPHSYVRPREEPTEPGRRGVRTLTPHVSQCYRELPQRLAEPQSNSLSRILNCY